MTLIDKINNKINLYNNIKNKYEFNNTNIYPYNKNRKDRNGIYKIYNFNFNNLISLNIYNEDQILNGLLLQYINIDDDILILTRNLVFLKLILKNLKTNNMIYVLLFYPYGLIDEIILLKKKYNNIKIYIYYKINKYNILNIYNSLTVLFKNKEFSSVLFDLYITESNFMFSILVFNKFLSNNGCYINLNKLPTKLNSKQTYYLYKLYNCFYNKYIYNEYYQNNLFKYNNIAISLYIFNNVRKKLNKKIINNIINDINNKIFIDQTEINVKLSKQFLQYIYIKWKGLYFAEINNYKRIINKNIIKHTNYNDNQNLINDNLIYINDIKIISKLDLNYNFNEINNYNLYCNFYEKRILLLYILVFTLIKKKKNISDYIIVINKFVIINLYKILLKLFPDIKLIIFDKDIEINFNNKNINLYNEYFNNEKNYYFLNNKKIIFISNYNNDLISNIDNMIYETNIGIKLNADFIITNFYIFENNFNLPNNITDLNIDDRYINNINHINKDDNQFVFLKGDLLIHSFTNDLIISIFIEKYNDKYNLDFYNINSNREKYYNYLLYYKYYFCARCINKYLEYLPGYELLKLEYYYLWNILSDYYKTFHDINDENILFNNLFDLFFNIQNITSVKILNCKYNTLLYEFKNTNKEIDYNKYIKLLYWKNISKIYISNSALVQKEFILLNKDQILNKNQIKQAITYLDEFIDLNKIYYKLLL